MIKPYRNSGDCYENQGSGYFLEKRGAMLGQGIGQGFWQNGKVTNLVMNGSYKGVILLITRCAIHCFFFLIEGLKIIKMAASSTNVTIKLINKYILKEKRIGEHNDELNVDVLGNETIIKCVIIEIII